MVIDFHTHTFPDRIANGAIDKLSRTSGTMPYTDGTESGLLQSMSEAGVQYSVTLPVATNPDKVSRINDTAVLNQPQDGLIRFGAIHPDCPHWKEELIKLASNGCKGIKLHPVYQNVPLDDLRYLRILDCAGELGLIVVTHAGDDIGFPGVIRCSPAMALHAIEEVGPVKLVLAHMGGWHCWDEVNRLLVDTPALLDTSFCTGSIALRPECTQDRDLGLMSVEYFTDMIRCFGADRVLFGTDSPWASQKDAVSLLQSLPLTEKEKEQILWQNAASLLQLDI